ncbi:MAG: XrtA-associated tyrosine autokinase [Pseudomonadota bacterium]|nr:XrtA-associated tyrosine autokinase [Pseudomonadota bacterium]
MELDLIERAARRLQREMPAEDPPASGDADVRASTAEAPAESSAPAPARPSRRHSARAGTVNLGRLQALGMVTPDGANRQLTEEFRRIKRPLLENAFGKKNVPPLRNGNLVMVTSAVAGEGKSFCAVNLAMSIVRELDNTVLLVDADVAKPSILDLLGLEGGRGLLDLILDESLEMADVLIKTDVEKLSVLPAGNVRANATELLASGAMHRLLQDMTQRYPDRIIIFDSPPLLITNESRVLATQMGQVVVVVEAGHTTQSAVGEALELIESCDVVNLLLNKSHSLDLASQPYGYGSYGG